MKAAATPAVGLAGLSAPRSMLMLGAQVRLGLAATLVGALWLAVWWALA
ncbi:MAG: hypothetical protein RLY71_244 [Pseudomonadota bacterium]|jgi:hypothetical protein